jgi:hypothetical protein
VDLRRGVGARVSRPFSFEEAVYRELDQIRRACERQADTLEAAVDRLEKRDEERDSEVSELKLQVAALQARAPEHGSTWKRAAGRGLAPSTVVAVVGALMQWFATQPDPPSAPRPPAHMTAPAPYAPVVP